jgi:hypothetical protein
MKAFGARSATGPRDPAGNRFCIPPALGTLHRHPACTRHSMDRRCLGARAVAVINRPFRCRRRDQLPACLVRSRSWLRYLCLRYTDAPPRCPRPRLQAGRQPARCAAELIAERRPPRVEHGLGHPCLLSGMHPQLEHVWEVHRSSISTYRAPCLLAL